MDKKGQTVQRTDDCAVAKGRDWRRENIVPAAFLRPLWMLSAPHMARFVVRLIAIRTCPRTGRYPKACTCSTMDNLSSNDLQIFRESAQPETLPEPCHYSAITLPFPSPCPAIDLLVSSHCCVPSPPFCRNPTINIDFCS